MIFAAGEATSLTDYGLLGGAAVVSFAIITFIDKREERHQKHADAEAARNQLRYDADVALLRHDLEAERTAHSETRKEVTRLSNAESVLRERSEKCEQDSIIANKRIEVLEQRIDDLMTIPARKPRNVTTVKKASGE